MIVEQSEIRLASSHVLAARTERRASMRSWMDVGGADNSTDRIPVGRRPVRQVESKADGAVPATGTGCPDGVSEGDGGLSPKDAQKVRLIEALIEFITGRKVKIKIWNGKPVDGSQEASTATGSSGAEAEAGSTGGRSAALEWGAEVRVDQTSWESESMTFSAQGNVKTADGRTLEFAFAMGMRRETSTSTSLSLSMGAAQRKKDPLVVDLGGGGARLADSTSPIDLDGDGTTENVHFATGSSAFLALDRGTGALDGSSLFGTATGDGFGELARLDSDGNGWIDSGDPAWADLRLWSRDEAGVDHVRRVDGSGIGAISLATAATPYSLRDGADREAGSMTETGVWIGESGQVGAVSHVDLVA